MLKRTSKMGIYMVFSGVGMLIMSVLLGGCRAHPVSLGVMLVGDLVADVDIKERAKLLINQPASKADEMFGERLETLEDTAAERVLVLYPAGKDFLDIQRYAVEVVSDTITSVSLMKHNIDGSENLLKQMLLKKKVLGKIPEECEKAVSLNSPVLIARSREQMQMVHVYDVKNWTNTRGARYCVLRFDQNNSCVSIDMIGVSATTQKNPADGSKEQ